MNAILKRIKEISQREGISVTALEAKIGASKGVFSRALANGTDIQSKWLVKLAENYPRYAAEWLLRGKGEMIKADIFRDPQETNSEGPTAHSDEVIQALKNVISTQETTIRSQAITIDTLQKRIAELERVR